MTESSPILSAARAGVVDLAAVRAGRERERSAAFESELRRRLCAFLDAPDRSPFARAPCGDQISGS